MNGVMWGAERVGTAVARLREFEPGEGYWLGFSGGKDSVVIYRLAEMAGVRFEAHFSLTTVDPPEVVDFVRRCYPLVLRDRPVETMWELIVRHGIPPMRQRRYCCAELKERGGAGRVVLTGVRWAESSRRRRRRMVEACYSGPHRTFVHPIIDWSTAEVWQFIRGEGLAYCRLYDEGFTRVGCVLCPMSRAVGRDVGRWPKLAAAYQRAFGRMVDRRRALGRRCTWADGRAVWDWWIARDGRPVVKAVPGPLFD